jgi:hypothetical protein
MLLIALGNIDSNTGIESVVGTKDDIHRPVHNNLILGAVCSQKPERFREKLSELTFNASKAAAR